MANLAENIPAVTVVEEIDDFNMFRHDAEEVLPEVVKALDDDLLAPSYASKMSTVTPTTAKEVEHKDEVLSKEEDLILAEPNVSDDSKEEGSGASTVADSSFEEEEEDDDDDDVKFEHIFGEDEIKDFYKKEEDKVIAAEAAASSDNAGAGGSANETFWSNFFGDANELWEMLEDTRESFHSLVFDFVVERPNGISELRTVQTDIINKGRSASDKEMEALKVLHEYLDGFEKRRTNYLLKLKYNKLQKKWGKKFIDLKMRELKIKEDLPQWVVPLVVFGLPEINAAIRMRNTTKSNNHQPKLSNM